MIKFYLIKDCFEIRNKILKIQVPYIFIYKLFHLEGKYLLNDLFFIYWWYDLLLNDFSHLFKFKIYNK